VKPDYTFVNVPASMENWRRDKESLWLVGETGLGKTEYALSLFKTPLLVSHMDQLKQLTPEHDGIVFDDVSIKHWPREAGIHLTDVQNKRGINVKHSCVVLRKGLQRVFTSNVAIFPEDPTGAIKRRVHCVMLTQKLYEGDKDPETKPADDWLRMETVTDATEAAKHFV